MKPGSSVHYWLSVRDKEPSSNKIDTARQLIEIGEPLPATEKKKFEDNQKIRRQPEITQTDQEQPTEQPQTEPGNADALEVARPHKDPRPRSIKHRRKPRKRPGTR